MVFPCDELVPPISLFKSPRKVDGSGDGPTPAVAAKPFITIP